MTEGTAPPSGRARLLAAGRILLTLLLLVLAYRRVAVDEVADAIARSRPVWLAAAFAALLVERFVTIAKWGVLLAAQGRPIPLRRLLPLYWRNNFFGFFLPTGLGIDVLNALSVARRGAGLARATSSVTVDRGGSLAGLAIVVLLSLSSGPRFAGEVARALLVLSLSIVAAALYLVLPVHATLSTTLARSAALRPAVHRLDRLYQAVTAFRRRPRALALNLLLSVVMQLLRVVVVGLVAAALGLGLPWRDVFSVVPASNVITALPLSIGGGLGLRENAYLYFFPRVGVAPADAIALSVLLLALVLLWLLPAGLWGMVQSARFGSSGPSHRRCDG